jgi:hypothetical protein
MSSEGWQRDVPNIADIETECPEVGASTTPIIWEKIQIEKKSRGVTESD